MNYDIPVEVIKTQYRHDDHLVVRIIIIGYVNTMFSKIN